MPASAFTTPPCSSISKLPKKSSCAHSGSRLRHRRQAISDFRGFTPAAVTKMHAELDRRTTALLDAFADRGSCEFGRDFASVLPTG